MLKAIVKITSSCGQPDGAGTGRFACKASATGQTPRPIASIGAN